MHPCVNEAEMTWPGGEEVVTVAGSSHEAAGEIANVPVAVASSRIEAELIVGMLRSNGVRAVISADDAGGQEPPLQIQGVRVLVPPSDEAPARQLLAEADETPS
jgi:Putative prokaryotic signal transducing protein